MKQNDSDSTISHFDRVLGALHGLPDVTHAKPVPIRDVPDFGIGTHMYVVQTFRQRDIGDTVFLEHVSNDGTIRIALPPKVTAAIARQREQLTGKVRSKAAKQVAAERKERGELPAFMKRRKKK